MPNAVMHIRYRDTLRGIYHQAHGYAEYNVLLYKRYRPLGMPQLSWKAGVSACGRLLKKSVQIRSKGALAAWLWQFGWRMGRLQGSIKHRIWAL